MIEPSITYVKDQLKDYLVSKIGATDGNVVLDNIANYDPSDTTSDLVNKVVISLVNVEEESTLKNNSFHRRNSLSGTIDMIDPPVHINLYILFTSTPDQTGDRYQKALIRLSYIIQFFQHRKKFLPVINFEGSERKNQLIFELYTLTFEQINHLWGSLGGKQVPFAMYKARLIELQELETQPTALIEEIYTTANNR